MVYKNRLETTCINLWIAIRYAEKLHTGDFILTDEIIRMKNKYQQQ